MKKKILIGLISIVIIITLCLYVNINKDDNQILESNNSNPVISNSSISMMYETEPDSGIYVEAKDTTWPITGYLYNETRSGCENGGILSWNQESKKVTLKNNTSDKCYVYFDAYLLPVVNNITTSNITTDSITLTVNATAGDSAITTYYYAYGDNEAVSSTSNTYTFNNLESGTEYNFRVYVIDEMGYESSILNVSARTEDPILLADWVIGEYNGIQGNNGIYYHTSSLANSASDNSYRYAGANPNNYVCFDSDAATCPSDNLYRIIGVFDGEVKLIKNASLGRNYWHTSSKIGYFPWSDSTLNNNIINGSFLTGLGEWANLISTHTWKVGGGPLTNLLYGPLSIAPTAYSYEVGANSSSTTYTAKIGLMYISDYYYAAPQTYWTYPGYTMGTTYPDANGNYGEDYDYRATVGSNWLYIGTDQWTITPSTNSTAACAYKAGATGAVDYKSIRTIADTRPVFYLNSDIQYSGGSGTIDNPIRISEN